MPKKYLLWILVEKGILLEDCYLSVYFEWKGKKKAKTDTKNIHFNLPQYNRILIFALDFGYFFISLHM